MFPAGWWVLKTRCAAYRRHNNCQFEALENQAIRTQCAASQYLNARENGSSLGQSVKIGQNCTGVGQFSGGIYRYYQPPKSCCVTPIGSAPQLAFSPSLQIHSSMICVHLKLTPSFILRKAESGKTDFRKVSAADHSGIGWGSKFKLWGEIWGRNG